MIYYRNALEAYKKLNSKDGIAISYQNIASVHEILEEYDKAIQNTQRALKICLETGERDGIALCYLNLAAYYIANESYNKATMYLVKRISLYEQLGRKSGLATSDTNKEMGTGLGLILCKEFADKNNGKISVESREGIGATFTLTLPV